MINSLQELHDNRVASQQTGQEHDQLASLIATYVTQGVGSLGLVTSAEQQHSDQQELFVLNEVVKSIQTLKNDLQGIVEAIKAVQINVPEIKLPTINVPEIKIPEIKVPEIVIPKIEVPPITVNVPEIKVPTVVLPKIELPIINVPEPKVTVNVPEIKVPPVVLPEPVEKEVEPTKEKRVVSMEVIKNSYGIVTGMTETYEDGSKVELTGLDKKKTAVTYYD